ncbi:MAG: hypothetical protein QGH40_05310 [bacterium]|nr:hypothetical protein [bacterium]
MLTGKTAVQAKCLLQAAVMAAAVMLAVPVVWAGGVSGPDEVFEDIPDTWRTTIKPFTPGALSYKDYKYTWRLTGPGGTFFSTGTRPSTHPVAWDTPSDPKKNKVKVILTYTCVFPNPELIPPTIEGPGIPVTGNMKVLVKDSTAPGQNGSTGVKWTSGEPIQGFSGESAEHDILVRVKDNNPNVGPDPGGMYVKMYYQIGPHEWQRATDELWDRKTGPFPCNVDYSDRTGQPERFYSYIDGSSPEGEVKVESRTPPYSPDPSEADGNSPQAGWPDSDYWWVGPLEMENQGVVEQGRKYSVTQWYLPRERVMLPLHFAPTSTDWQPLKVFIEIMDASGNSLGKDYIEASKAHSDSKMVTEMTPTDDKLPWMSIKVEDFRTHRRREFSLYMSPWDIFYNMDHLWEAADDYRWPPPDGRNSFLEPADTFFQEDVRLMFHVFACDNIEREDTEVLYSQDDLNHLAGCKEDSLLFQVFRLQESGEWVTEIEVAGQNDFLVEKVFPTAADYVIRFEAEDLAGNKRTMVVDLPLTDTAIRHTDLEYDSP